MVALPAPLPGPSPAVAPSATARPAPAVPYAAALAAAAVARVAAACLAPGFYARDDYFHVVAPAQAWLADRSFDWAHSGLPGAGIRSHLLPRLVWLLLRGMAALGITAPEAQLRGLYLAMGAYSLALVPAMAMAARASFGPAAARRAAWLAALYFALPFVGTRLLIEALAMVPLAAAVACLPRLGRRHAAAGGLLVALACWWRLQVAAALPGLAVALGLCAPRGRRLGLWASLGLGLALGLAAQGAFDVATGQAPFAPLWGNLAVNLHPHAGLSRSTVWGYLGFWLMMSVPPVAPWLLAGGIAAAARAPFVSLPWLSFVVVHALVPHKEDRFMLPVLPLFLLLLAAAPEGLAAVGGRAGAWLRRTWPAARMTGKVVGALFLLLACTAASQANLRAAMVALRQDVGARAAISLGPELQTFYLGARALPTRRHPQPDAAWLATTQAALSAAGTPANRFLAYAADQTVVEVLLRLRGLDCAPPEVIPGYWLDRVVFRLNPRRNRRRGPLLLYRCASGALARAEAAADADGARTAPHLIGRPTEHAGDNSLDFRPSRD